VNVRRLELVNVLGHKRTELNLPERGVVLVTGPNGAGKSALPEAASYAVWGKTLRGTPPWRKDGSPGTVACAADSVDVTRERSGSRVGLSWKVPGDEDPAEFDTTTKAQEALEHVVGSWDVWRRTCVFSSADASHFSGATDGERKRLLEEILGLGRFDVALAACRADLRAVETRRSAADGDARVLRERVQRMKDSLGQARASLRALPAAPPLPTSASADLLRLKLDKLRQSRATCDRELATAQAALRSAEARRGAAESTVAALERQAARTKESVCHTCGQTINAGQRAKIEAELGAARGEAAKAGGVATAAADEVAESVKDLEAERQDIDEALHRVQKEQSAAEEAARSARARETLTAQADQAEKHLKGGEEELFKAEAALAVAVSEAAVLGAVEQVLGLRGVRASILGRALSGLEVAVNARVARLFRGGGVAVELKAWSEKKTGGISDAISMAVSGVGDGHGYKAASQGQRRRLDVAMLLALADVAAAAHGARAGTIWMDEVFDALDPEGEDAVCGLLPEIAAERCVVVITHSPSLVQRLPATMRVQVADGGKLSVS